MKKAYIFLLLGLTFCIGLFSACNSKGEDSSKDVPPQQSSSWVGENVEDKTREEIELPEIERP